MVGPRRCATCNRAVFWACEWLGMEGDLSAPLRPMHRSGRDMKNASRCQATPVTRPKAASAHMTRDMHGDRAVRLLVVGLGFRLDPRVGIPLWEEGAGQVIQTPQARWRVGIGTAQRTTRVSPRRTTCVCLCVCLSLPNHVERWINVYSSISKERVESPVLSDNQQCESAIGCRPSSISSTTDRNQV